MKTLTHYISEDFRLKKKGNIAGTAIDGGLSSDIAKKCLGIQYRNYDKLKDKNDKEIIAVKNAIKKWIAEYNIKDISSIEIFADNDETVDVILNMYKKHDIDMSAIKIHSNDQNGEQHFNDKLFAKVDTYFETYPEFCIDPDFNSCMFGNKNGFGFASQIEFGNDIYDAGDFTIYFIV